MERDSKTFQKMVIGTPISRNLRVKNTAIN